MSELIRFLETAEDEAKRLGVSGDLIRVTGGPMPNHATLSGSAAAQKHYQVGAVQPIEYCQMVLTPEEFVGAMKFNVIKYVSRCGHKDAPVKEADKIVQYAKWLRKSLNGETIKPMEDD